MMATIHSLIDKIIQIYNVDSFYCCNNIFLCFDNSNSFRIQLLKIDHQVRLVSVLENTDRNVTKETMLTNIPKPT